MLFIRRRDGGRGAAARRGVGFRVFTGRFRFEAHLSPRRAFGFDDGLGFGPGHAERRTLVRPGSGAAGLEGLGFGIRRGGHR